MGEPPVEESEGESEGVWEADMHRVGVGEKRVLGVGVGKRDSVDKVEGLPREDTEVDKVSDPPPERVKEGDVVPPPREGVAVEVVEALVEVQALPLPVPPMLRGVGVEAPPPPVGEALPPVGVGRGMEGVGVVEMEAGWVVRAGLGERVGVMEGDRVALGDTLAVVVVEGQ